MWKRGITQKYSWSFRGASRWIAGQSQASHFGESPFLPTSQYSKTLMVWKCTNEPKSCLPDKWLSPQKIGPFPLNIHFLCSCYFSPVQGESGRVSLALHQTFHVILLLQQNFQCWNKNMGVLPQFVHWGKISRQKSVCVTGSGLGNNNCRHWVYFWSVCFQNNRLSRQSDIFQTFRVLE